VSDHLITPPPELVQQWWTDAQTLESDNSQEIRFIVNVAARWGANQELEACCEWFANEGYGTAPDRIRMHRRPKPPSLKELALEAFYAVATGANDIREQHQDLDTIRKALEALPND
jgi:hypothetical protein